MLSSQVSRSSLVGGCQVWVYQAGLEITAGQRTMSEPIWELTGQPFVLPVMYYHLRNFDLKSWVKCNKNCCLQFRHWNIHQGSRSSSTPELQCLIAKLFSMNTNFSSLVMRSNLDYWRSFRIKISHRDTYTRNHYMWRHLLCIYLFTKCVQ